jgi:hypothetical protein
MLHHLVTSVTNPLKKHADKASAEAKRQSERQEDHDRRESFEKGHQARELANHVVLSTVEHSHAMEAKQADHAHEANMLKLAHTVHRGTVRAEQKAGVTEGNTTFSTPTVQANGGTRKFGAPSAPAATPAAKPAAAAKPAVSRPAAAEKPISIGTKKPRATKAQQKPAGSTGINFQAP